MANLRKVVALSALLAFAGWLYPGVDGAPIGRARRFGRSAAMQRRQPTGSSFGRLPAYNRGAHMAQEGGSRTFQVAEEDILTDRKPKGLVREASAPDADERTGGYNERGLTPESGAWASRTDARKQLPAKPGDSKVEDDLGVQDDEDGEVGLNAAEIRSGLEAAEADDDNEPLPDEADNTGHLTEGDDADAQTDDDAEPLAEGDDADARTDDDAEPLAEADDADARTDDDAESLADAEDAEARPEAGEGQEADDDGAREDDDDEVQVEADDAGAPAEAEARAEVDDAEALTDDEDAEALTDDEDAEARAAAETRHVVDSAWGLHKPHRGHAKGQAHALTNLHDVEGQDNREDANMDAAGDRADEAPDAPHNSTGNGSLTTSAHARDGSRPGAGSLKEDVVEGLSDSNGEPNAEIDLRPNPADQQDVAGDADLSDDGGPPLIIASRPCSGAHEIESIARDMLAAQGLNLSALSTLTDSHFHRNGHLHDKAQGMAITSEVESARPSGQTLLAQLPMPGPGRAISKSAADSLLSHQSRLVHIFRSNPLDLLTCEIRHCMQHQSQSVGMRPTEDAEGCVEANSVVLDTDDLEGTLEAYLDVGAHEGALLNRLGFNDFRSIATEALLGFKSATDESLEISVEAWTNFLMSLGVSEPDEAAVTKKLVAARGALAEGRHSSIISNFAEVQAVLSQSADPILSKKTLRP